jgi:hypothetical protein
MTATLSPLDVNVNAPLKQCYTAAWRHTRLFGTPPTNNQQAYTQATAHASSSYRHITSSTIKKAFALAVQLPPSSAAVSAAFLDLQTRANAALSHVDACLADVLHAITSIQYQTS